MSKTYERRGGPVDIAVERAGLADRGGGGNAAADKDYFSGIKKFSGHTESSAAEPNRNKGNESGQKPGK